MLLPRRLEIGEREVKSGKLQFFQGLRRRMGYFAAADLSDVK